MTSDEVLCMYLPVSAVLGSGFCYEHLTPSFH